MTATTDAAVYMIPRALPGRPPGALKSGQHASLMLEEALRQVQAVPIADCRFEACVAVRLRERDYLLAHGLVANDVDLLQW